MYAESKRHTRAEVVTMLASAFCASDIAVFGPKDEEKLHKVGETTITVNDCLKIVSEERKFSGEELSSLSDIHPAWIVQTLSNESPKIIGIILRWLPSRHVRYILEHLPKRIKMSLPKLVDSFAVPTPILALIKAKFEQKFTIPSGKIGDSISFEDIGLLKSDELEILFRDLGMHELSMAFQNVESSGVRVLLNRMSVSDARALQQRIKDVADTSQNLLRDARYSILEVALDQEDIEKLLMEIGLTAFSKALKDDNIFTTIQMRLDPKVSYVLRRYIDQHVGANKLAKERQMLILERVILLSRAGQIDSSWAERIMNHGKDN